MSSHPEPLDSVQRADLGEVDAICERLKPSVEVHVRGHLRDDVRRWVDPEDLAQQVILELRERWSTLQKPIEEGRLRAWLCRRADWRMADVGRKHAALRGETLFPNTCAAAGDFTDGTVTRDDTRQLIRRLVSHLPAKYAEVVQLCALEGKTFVEVGRRLDLKPDTVRRRYENARTVLARRLPSFRDG